MRSINSANVALVGAILVLAVSSLARAQTPPAGGDKVAAEALFEDGRKLAATGKYSEACPKFAESQRLDPSPSTLLNLANCWEKLGRSATAWATYREAESAAHAVKRQDYLATAQRHADALAPKLARLTVNVVQPVAGILVKRDGAPVGPAEWGAAIPVDAGSHSMEANAPGYKPWTTTVDVSPDGAQVTTTVPPLESLPPELSPSPAPGAAQPPSAAPPAIPAPAPSAGETPPHSNAQRIIGIVVMAAGVGGLGVGGVFALVANGKNIDSRTECPVLNVCSEAGVAERKDALWAGDAATVAVSIGAAAVVTGAALWFFAPTSVSSKSALASIVVAPTLGGAVLKGDW
jgi:hypothetical protein